MIHPRSPDGCKSCFNICAIVYLHPRKMDLTLTAMVISHVSSDVSCTLANLEEDSIDMPALLTSLRVTCQYSRTGEGSLDTSSHIDASICLDGLFYQGLPIFHFAHVGSHEDGLSTILSDQFIGRNIHFRRNFLTCSRSQIRTHKRSALL